MAISAWCASGSNFSTTTTIQKLPSGPDYPKLAEAYGLYGMRITRREDVATAVRTAMETEGTVIIDFVIEPESNVYPMVAPGSAITSMIEEPVEENAHHD